LGLPGLPYGRDRRFLACRRRLRLGLPRTLNGRGLLASGSSPRLRLAVPLRRGAGLGGLALVVSANGAGLLRRGLAPCARLALLLKPDRSGALSLHRRAPGGSTLPR
jgi:hypothetical protein